MIILLIGPQGSGKGTQAQIISTKLGIPHVSTGDILRSNTNKEFRKEIDSYINQGRLVPNELILKILRHRILEKDCKKGFILDGFPRTLEQARALDKILKIDKVIEISIPDEESIRRLSGRMTCKKCNAVYNTLSSSPKIKNICDKCGGVLYQRADDNEESIKKRLEIYHKETEPILKHYSSVKINGNQKIDKVNEDILKALEKG